MPAFSRPDSVLSEGIAPDAATIQRLTECRSEFLRFFRRRLSRQEDAEDAFQDFCLKVVRATEKPKTTGKTDAWLSRVLRNTLTDYYRRRAARQRAEAAYEAEAPEPVVQPGTVQLENPCSCVRNIVPTLRPDYAEIIRRADLEEESRERIAVDLGLTTNNIGVRLHRARRALKEKIEERCGACCVGGFGSCDCAPESHGRHRGGRDAPACSAAITKASL
ncbi:RNA polymerase sigma factor [Aurantimonas marianensis]|uniref:Sigma-70 family RNA polymerase sigma factor n=1 Tax=Aurantimonas marianensis TaxID=2920428 RepID=A0A9X2H8J1_9HYPH|nr:sigma-70 family RNA polymerase sigma factor [Aurantimonas marianensis]MCP3055723.1 sigma-70 family RNA polymerase sigma factor [Aurantimonas marianensis]